VRDGDHGRTLKEGIMATKKTKGGRAMGKKELKKTKGGLNFTAPVQSQDRLGNFEIQRLMSNYNQAETLSSNVQKKMDDTVSGQQQKIG
jgi:hypothetical protein